MSLVDENHGIRSLGEAFDPDDLNSHPKRNTVADETAKLINKQDIAPLKEAADVIRIHSEYQIPDERFADSIQIPC